MTDKTTSWTALLGGCAALALAPAIAHAAKVEVIDEIKHDTSPPLAYMIRANPPARATTPRAIPLRPIPLPAAGLQGEDLVLQTRAGAPVGTTDLLNIAGVGQGDYGFSDSSAPPDTNGSVGLTQYVQIVNQSFGIFNKTTGALLVPVAATNTVFAGFGGVCETTDDGDGTVVYDRLANRWIITQLSVELAPYTQCVAVSKTSDATGAYNRYAFSYGNDFNDYPKLGVWPDGYYTTYNIFLNGQSFIGAKLCALHRRAMLRGKKAAQQCFQLTSTYGGVLPADLDGKTPPPAGSPEFFVNFGSNSLHLWKFHVDWITPTNTTLSGPATISVPAFSPLCGGGTCVPQLGGNALDSLADRLMYRLAYRNFGTRESLVVNHSVKAGTSGGVRWYELATPGTTPSLVQSGTYAPDASYRWMGSITEDKQGNMAVGYSISSASLHPEIGYTGRLVTDPLGTMQGEKIVKAGARQPERRVVPLGRL